MRNIEELTYDLKMLLTVTSILFFIFFFILEKNGSLGKARFLFLNWKTKGRFCTRIRFIYTNCKIFWRPNANIGLLKFALYNTFYQ